MQRWAQPELLPSASGGQCVGGGFRVMSVRHERPEPQSESVLQNRLKELMQRFTGGLTL